ncbi:hypothetical protein KDN34_15670 [Shewanella yunxiaonensis]|uniref:UPF0306 protein KDN34_15670 n=1 Tax=Shewanella yunxiaonensis TaxID=2829809 RepID=A0ABX7YS53_9GAMM|nr:YhbP family protein [Shewanella yunxiaonensis]QUN05604.1 hypothetical protein KDN34_15670 [Shewanella yunxiaonensis]
MMGYLAKSGVTMVAVPDAISQYLQQQHVLTLCTQDQQGLWCASCFYVFDVDSMCCYLMTADNSRHTQAMVVDPIIAGTIADQTQSVLHIQGIQYTAIASRVSESESAAIRQLYCQRFPVAKVKSAPLWRLALQTVKMVDNRLGFGKKHRWQRQPD